jgi:macrolide-specific efflux system membrane fusion protein
VLALVVLGIVAVVLMRQFKAPEPLAVTTATVSRGDLEVGVLATGTIEAAKLVSVGAQATGELTHLAGARADIRRAPSFRDEVPMCLRMSAVQSSQRDKRDRTINQNSLTRSNAAS